MENNYRNKKYMLKLNIGSHSKRIEGYTNVDALQLENVDVQHNLIQAPWPFDNNSVDEILAQEFVEHISFKYTHVVLGECWRILKPGGVLKIQVPDIGAMCNMFVQNQICNCVPRKAAKYEDYKADPNCFSCGGQGLIHPERWRVAFSGAQKHEYDAHLNHFTEDILRETLERSGFTELHWQPNIYKLIVEAVK